MNVFETSLRCTVGSDEELPTPVATSLTSVGSGGSSEWMSTGDRTGSGDGLGDTMISATTTIQLIHRVNSRSLQDRHSRSGNSMTYLNHYYNVPELTLCNNDENMSPL
jgi:hypothetical protein